MAFQINNPTLKNIIDFLKNQLSNVATDTDISVGDTENWYGRKNGVWSKIQGGGGGGESTNIGDEVYTDGSNLIIKSASTEVKNFFGQIANDFNDALSYSTGNLVMYNKELYRFTSDYVAGSGDSLTTHAVTTTIDMGLQQKAPIASPKFTGTPQLSTTPTENSNNYAIADTAYVDRAATKREVLIITTDNFSSLPYSVSGSSSIAAKVEDDMIPITMDLSNPAAQIGTWKITTGAAQFSITGTNAISGTTNATLYFIKTRTS